MTEPELHDGQAIAQKHYVNMRVLTGQADAPAEKPNDDIENLLEDAYSQRVKARQPSPDTKIRTAVPQPEMRVAYELALTHYRGCGFGKDGAPGALWQAPIPGLALQSQAMMRCVRLSEAEDGLADPHGATFAAWLMHGETAFEKQRFTPAEVHRWISEKEKPPATAPVHRDGTATSSTENQATVVIPDASVVARPKKKRDNAWGEALPYLQSTYKNGKFKTTSEYIRELKNQSGNTGSPFKKSDRTEDCFFLKVSGKSISHSLLEDRMKDIR